MELTLLWAADETLSIAMVVSGHVYISSFLFVCECVVGGAHVCVVVFPWDKRVMSRVVVLSLVPRQRVLEPSRCTVICSLYQGPAPSGDGDQSAGDPHHQRCRLWGGELAVRLACVKPPSIISSTERRSHSLNSKGQQICCNTQLLTLNKQLHFSQ